MKSRILTNRLRLIAIVAALAGVAQPATGRSTENVFRMTEISRSGTSHIRISGDLILKGNEREVISWQIPISSSEASPPPARMPPPSEVRWVLPERSHQHYRRVKEYSRDVGYEATDRGDESSR
jgi:hypothetical protein